MQVNVKVLIIVCPIPFRESFYKNFLDLLRETKLEEGTHFERVTPLVTKRVKRLKKRDYTFVPKKFFKKELKENPGFFLTTSKNGKNGHAVFSGFQVGSLFAAKNSEKLVIYDTWDEKLAKRAHTFYRRNAKSIPIKTFIISETAI